MLLQVVLVTFCQFHFQPNHIMASPWLVFLTRCNLVRQFDPVVQLIQRNLWVPFSFKLDWKMWSTKSQTFMKIRMELLHFRVVWSSREYTMLCSRNLGVIANNFYCTQISLEPNTLLIVDFLPPKSLIATWKGFRNHEYPFVGNFHVVSGIILHILHLHCFGPSEQSHTEVKSILKTTEIYKGPILTNSCPSRWWL